MPVSEFLGDGTRLLAFAHRGFARGATSGAENTMAAFQAAVDLGYRYLETDVRASADGIALVFHDATLRRVTGRPGRIAELPWSQVAAARIGGREPIPLLVDVLGTWPAVCVNLDLKSAASLEPALDAIRRTGSVARVCVASVSHTRVAAARAALGPALCTSLSRREVIRLLVARDLRRPARGLAGNCAQVPVRAGVRRVVDPRFLAAAHDAGLPVHVWTIDDPAEMRRLLDAGVDGIITDRADALRAVLIERGQW